MVSGLAKPLYTKIDSDIPLYTEKPRRVIYSPGLFMYYLLSHLLPILIDILTKTAYIVFFLPATADQFTVRRYIAFGIPRAVKKPTSRLTAVSYTHLTEKSVGFFYL